MNVIATIDAQGHPFLTGKAKRLFINGKWVEAASGKTFDTHNPSTGAVHRRRRGTLIGAGVTP